MICPPVPRSPFVSRSRGRGVAAFFLFVLASTAALAAGGPSPPPYYAIRDARVAVGDGTTLERATVLIADGLIEAVGADLEIPGDAWILEGQGLTVYPGLIDGLGDLGQVAAEEGDGSRGGGGWGGSSAPAIRGPEDRPATTPWTLAADHLGDDARIESWREVGFTAAVSAPGDGIFPGQASLVHLGDVDDPRDRVLAPSVAQRIRLEPMSGWRTFPGSLMGVIAYVEQVFLDTRHYVTAQDLYARDPEGRERPEYDRTLDPLARALAGNRPFLVPADVGRHLDRALVLADRLEIPAILVGGQGAYARVDEVRAAGRPVLVDLDWPEEEKDRDPEADTPFRTLVHRRMAPATPRLLAEAGVPFGFFAGTISSPSQVFAKVRAAVGEGLSPDDALAALTSSVAGIYGVDDRLGTVEPGKIANLILASAEPWAEDVEIEAVFVDGRKYQEPAEDEDLEPPAADVSGTWELTATTPRGTFDFEAELQMASDGKVTGETTSEQGERTVEKGRMSGDLLRWESTTPRGTSKISLTIEGERAEGTLSAGPMSFTIEGERTEIAESGSGEADERSGGPTLAELREALELYQGPVPGDAADGTLAVENVTVWTLAGDGGPQVLEDAVVVVRDGKIAAVGAAVSVPDGVPVVDGGGGDLIPGIIDAHSHIAVEGGVNEGSIAVSSMVAIADVLDPDDIDIYRALAGGVTTANILHGSANPIGGKNAVIKLRWGFDAAGLELEGAPAGIKFALGENPKRSNFQIPGQEARYPTTRMGVMDVIRTAFTEAREYREDWRRYREAEEDRGSRRGRRDGGDPPTPPRRDLQLEALVQILEGDRLVHSHCYRADEILQLLRLGEEQGFRVATLQHVLEGYKVADEIAAHGAGASTFSDWWGYKVEAYDAIPHNAALMAERGVLVSINSDSAEEMRHLNQEAAKAIKWGGMDAVEALKMVTLNPAIQLGIDDRVGSIEVGKDADLVLYDGDPLAIRSVVQRTWVDGRLYFDREADRDRRERLEALEARLTGEDGDEDGAESADEPATGEPETAAPPDDPWTKVRYSCREEATR